MWAGVGVLLGLMVVASVLGFHVGPHGHLAAIGLGVAAGVIMVVMAATGQAAPLLWVLLGADVAISGSLGVLTWRGLRQEDEPLHEVGPRGIVGAEGVAVTDLDPEGIVRVRGENWSATSMNRPARAGDRVQVIETSGVRLGVWSEDEVVGLGDDPIDGGLANGRWHEPDDDEHKGAS